MAKEIWFDCRFCEMKLVHKKVAGTRYECLGCGIVYDRKEQLGEQ